MKKVYPVIFTDTSTNILIEVPDLKILTEANEEGDKKASFADAIITARDAIGLSCISAEDGGSSVAEASALYEIDAAKGAFAGEGKSIVSLVDVDLAEYRRKVDNKTVRRNVTLPNWLNQEAEAANLNVSRVLQEALIQKLNVHR